MAPAMSAQFAPVASQRCQRAAKVIVGVPVHAPSVTVSVWVSTSVPETDGAVVFAGGAGATTCASDADWAVPPGPVAVTTARTA